MKGCALFDGTIICAYFEVWKSYTVSMQLKDWSHWIIYSTWKGYYVEVYTALRNQYPQILKDTTLNSFIRWLLNFHQIKLCTCYRTNDSRSILVYLSCQLSMIDVACAVTENMSLCLACAVFNLQLITLLIQPVDMMTWPGGAPPVDSFETIIRVTCTDSSAWLWRSLLSMALNTL